MTHNTLHSAVYCLEQLVYKTGCVDDPSKAESSPEAKVNKRLYDRCIRTLDSAHSKLAGTKQGSLAGIEEYEELLDALECTITDYPLLQDAMKMLNACEAVICLLRETA